MKKHDCNFFYGKTVETNLRDGGAMRMKYCPICGKLLGRNDPLSLEELIELHGKPVYITCEEFPNLNAWYVAMWDNQCERIICWGYDSTKMDTSTYGTWYAYLEE